MPGHLFTFPSVPTGPASTTEPPTTLPRQRRNQTVWHLDSYDKESTASLVHQVTEKLSHLYLCLFTTRLDALFWLIDETFLPTLFILSDMKGRKLSTFHSNNLIMMVDFFMDVENAMHRLFQINSKKQG